MQASENVEQRPAGEPDSPGGLDLHSIWAGQQVAA